jgi:HAD superfamily hydrolase (TIGR01509 family)
MSTASEDTDNIGGVILDLDGTLVDSVYQQVVAWRRALDDCGIQLSVWKIHRRIGMSGDLLINGLVRETNRQLDAALVDDLRKRYSLAYAEERLSVRPLPGSRELLEALTSDGVAWTIATSSRAANAAPALKMLGVSDDIPVVTSEQVRHAKPDPDLFIKAASVLGVDLRQSLVVGDSVWDLLAARRAGALGVGLLSGGYGREELERAGAYRVYDDPLDLLNHLDEVGIRRSF